MDEMHNKISVLETTLSELQVQVSALLESLQRSSATALDERFEALEAVLKSGHLQKILRCLRGKRRGGEPSQSDLGKRRERNFREASSRGKSARESGRKLLLTWGKPSAYKWVV